MAAITFGAVARADLVAKYMEQPFTWEGRLELRDDAAAQGFARHLERCAEGMVAIDAIKPPEQDVRQRRLRSLGVALEKLADQLQGIDERALAYALHEIDKATSEDGNAEFATDPVRAWLIAGPLRGKLDDALRRTGRAVLDAADTLPKAERKEVDSQLLLAQHLRRLFEIDGLPFKVSDAGFAAHCFEAVFELANPGRTCRARYWLVQVAP